LKAAENIEETERLTGGTVRGTKVSPHWRRLQVWIVGTEIEVVVGEWLVIIQRGTAKYGVVVADEDLKLLFELEKS
jgi:hypothetical protein